MVKCSIVIITLVFRSIALFVSFSFWFCFLLLLFAMCSHLLLYKTRFNCTALCSHTIVCVVFACVDFFSSRLACIDRNRASWRGENNVWIMFRAIVMMALNSNNDCNGPCSLPLTHSSRSHNVCAATNKKIRFHEENKSLHRYSLLHTIEWASNVEKMFAFHWLCFVVIDRVFSSLFFGSSIFFASIFFVFQSPFHCVCIFNRNVCCPLVATKVKRIWNWVNFFAITFTFAIVLLMILASFAFECNLYWFRLFMYSVN